MHNGCGSTVSEQRLTGTLSGSAYWNCVNMTNRTCSVVSCQIESHASLLGCTSFEQHCSISIQSSAGYLKLHCEVLITCKTAAKSPLCRVEFDCCSRLHCHLYQQQPVHIALHHYKVSYAQTPSFAAAGQINA
jgi:hypothetical protein